MLTYQGERTEGDVRKLAATLHDCAAVLPLDVQDDAQIAAAVARRGRGAGRASTSWSTPWPTRGRRTSAGASSTPRREGFHLALDVSAYSLAALAREAEPHMRARGGGSIMTLSYIAADRAVPGYNVMGVAKAALESIVRYLAWDLGDGGIRVNAISAGPGAHARRARHPRLRLDGRQGRRAHAAAPRDHPGRGGDAALFLASPLSASVTGETMFVDAGFHAMGF